MSQVDLTTKVVHRLAHAVRLCSTASEECMFYGKSDVQEDVILEQFEVIYLSAFKRQPSFTPISPQLPRYTLL